MSESQPGTDVVFGLTPAQLRALVSEAVAAAPKTTLSPEDKEALSEVRQITSRLRWIYWLLIAGLVFAGGNLVAIWQLPGRVSQLEDRLAALEQKIANTQPQR